MCLFIFCKLQATRLPPCIITLKYLKEILLHVLLIETNIKMSLTNFKALYSIAPGFRVDRDEDWMPYLAQDEQLFLKKQRESILAKNEQLDDLKTVEKTKDVSEQITILTEEINGMIKLLLKSIPKLKEKAIKAREDAIQRDFENSPTKRFRLGENNEDIDFTDTNIDFVPDDFMPRHLTKANKPVDSRPLPPPSTTQPSVSQQTKNDQNNPPRDRLFENICPEDKAIISLLRPIIEKYDCKDRVMEALTRFRRRDRTLEALESLKSYVNNYKKRDKDQARG